MGAWGHGVFDNDDAMDWVCELEDATGPEILGETFDLVPSDLEEYVEMPEASSALAAAEVVAALLGKPSTDLPEDVTKWIGANRGLKVASLVRKAKRAVRRVLDNSELADEWGDDPDWQVRGDDLLRRLG